MTTREDGFDARIREAREEAVRLIGGNEVAELEKRELRIVPVWMVSDVRSFRNVQMLYQTLHRVLMAGPERGEEPG